MSRWHPNRRQFLAGVAAGVGGGLISNSLLSRSVFAQRKLPANERLGVGVIGMRYQGTVIAIKAQLYGDVPATLGAVSALGGLLARARLLRQRRAAALAAVELNRLGALRPAGSRK